jgi:hypothetical protein
MTNGLGVHTTLGPEFQTTAVKPVEKDLTFAEDQFVGRFQEQEKSAEIQPGPHGQIVARLTF